MSLGYQHLYKSIQNIMMAVAISHSFKTNHYDWNLSIGTHVLKNNWGSIQLRSVVFYSNDMRDIGISSEHTVTFEIFSIEDHPNHKEKPRGPINKSKQLLEESLPFNTTYWKWIMQRKWSFSRLSLVRLSCQPKRNSFCYHKLPLNHRICLFCYLVLVLHSFKSYK